MASLILREQELDSFAFLGVSSICASTSTMVAKLRGEIYLGASSVLLVKYKVGGSTSQPGSIEKKSIIHGSFYKLNMIL